MSRVQTNTFNINARQAIQSLKSLSSSIKDYNRDVRDSAKAQKDLESSSSRLRSQISGLNRPMSVLQSGVVKTREAFTALRSEIRQQERTTSKLNDGLKTLRTNVQSVGKTFQSVEQGAAQLDGRLRQAADSVQQFTASLANETASLRAILSEMKAYESVVQSASNKMKIKNQMLNEQAVATLRDAQAAQRLNFQTRELTTSFDRETRAINDKNAALLRALQIFFAMTNAQRKLGQGASVPRLGQRGQLSADFPTSVDTIGVTTNEARTTRDASIAGRQWGTEMLRIEQASRKKNRAIREQTGVVFKEVKQQKDAVESSRQLERTWLELRIAIGVLISRGLNALINAIQQSVQDANELSKKIAEVQTVSLELSNGILKTAKSTGEWKDELQALSRTFGIRTLETTEALYEALSNQVVRAGQATNFMAQEMKLAITAVSTLDEAVDVTSTVMNAFHKSTTDAARINAVLFKAVDLGRFRLNELGSEFGRVSVLSNQLGISFEEQAGSIALLTRLGLNADVAQTLLTNVQLKLIKPTETMAKLFAEWGVTSGEAAVKTFGFANVIQKLAETSNRGGDQMAELAEIFQDLRAITGAQGLVSNFTQLQSTINEVSNATEAFNEAFTLSLDALGRKADIELEKLRQQFLNTFGERLLRTFVNVSKAFGGADVALKALITTVRVAVEAWVAYRIALIAVDTSSVITVRRINTFFGSFARLTVSINRARASLIAFARARDIATLGITAFVAGIAELVVSAQTMRETLEESFVALRSELLEKARQELEKTNDSIDTFSKRIEQTNSSIFRTYFQFVASIRAANNALSEDFQKNFKKIKDTMVDGLKVSTDLLEDKLKLLTDRIKSVQKAIDDLKDRSIKAKAEADEKGFEAGLVGKSDEAALREIFARKRKLDADALDALRRGELELADELFRRTEKLASDAERRIEEFKNKVKRDADEISLKISSTGASALTSRSGGLSRTFSRTGPGTPRFTVGAGDLGRGFLAITRTAPKSAVTDVLKTEIVDTERLKTLEEALLTLRTDSLKMEKDKVAAIEAGIRLKEAEKKSLEAEAKTRTKSLNDFKTLVAEIDSFDTKQKDAGGKFGGLLDRTEAAGRAAGLTPQEQLQFLRQANATKILLEREAKTKAAADALDIETKALKEAESKADAARKRRVDEEKKAAEQIEAFGAQGIELSARVRGETDSFIGGLFAGDFGGKSSDRIQALREANARFEELNRKLLETRRAGGDVAVILKEIEQAQKDLNFTINEVETDRGIGRRGAGEVRDTSGRLTLDGKTRLSDTAGASAKALAEVKATIDASQKAAVEFAFAQSAMAKLQTTLASIPPEIRNQIEASREASKATVTATEAINRVYDGTLARLFAIIRAQNEIEAARKRQAGLLGAAGPVVPRAFGGGLPGTDRNLVALSSGEYVMNRLATRTYEPILRVMNGIRPQFRAGGGNVSIGDINVNTTTSTTSAQALEIARELERLSRRGLFSLKG